MRDHPSGPVKGGLSKEVASYEGEFDIFVSSQFYNKRDGLSQGLSKRYVVLYFCEMYTGILQTEAFIHEQNAKVVPYII